MFGFPLLLIPLAVCNIIVFLTPGVSFAAPLFTLPLYSGAGWTVTLNDAMVAFGLLLLLLEVQKSARPGGKYLTDHLLALLVFAGAAAEFVMLPQFANATFFLLTLIALVDFLSGLALRGRRPRRTREVVATEPAVQPVVVRETVPVREPVAPREPLRAREPVIVTPVAPIETAPVEASSIQAPLHPEPVRAEPLRPEPLRPDPARVEPARVEPIVDMDPMLGDQDERHDPAKAEPRPSVSPT